MIELPYLNRRRVVGAAAVVSLGFAIGGCSAVPNSKDADGLNLREPSPSFMKKVEKDPFPRAGAVQTSAS